MYKMEHKNVARLHNPPFTYLPTFSDITGKERAMTPDWSVVFNESQ